MKYIAIAVVLALIIFFFAKSISNKKAAAENLEIGKQFLMENKTRKDVKETESGLQYIVLQSGDGKQRPNASSTVKVHYHGTLIDGSVFDSSVDRGEAISFPLNRVIKGWTEGLQLMVVGDKFKFFIPAELAYGNSAAGSIEPGSTLIFDVELLDIKKGA
jgi:peptidylprolyl isomerase